MAVLDAFYILFKSQGVDEVKKSEEEVKKSGDKLNESLKNTQNLSNKAGESFVKMGKEMLGFVTAAFSIGAVLHGIKDSIDYAINLDRASQALQVNIEELDAWGNAVKRIGGTVEGFESSIQNLAFRLGSTGETALKVLPQLADTFQQMGRFAAQRQGQILGLDENTILLLQKGRREVEAIVAQQRELGVVTKKQGENAREFSYAWNDATHSFRTAFLGVADDLLPLLTKIINIFGSIAQYFAKHSGLITGALIGIGIAAATIIAPFIAANAAIIGLVAAVGVAIGVFALLYEDIKVFFSGGNSLIGHFANNFKNNIKEMGEFFHNIFDKIEKYFHFIVKLSSKIKSFFSENKIDFGLNIDDQSNKDKENYLPDENNNRNQSRPSYLFNNHEGMNDLSRLQSAISLANNSPLAAQTSNSIYNGQLSKSYNNNSRSVNRNTTINTGPITVNTQATDGQSVANALGNSLNDHLIQANNYYDDGINI